MTAVEQWARQIAEVAKYVNAAERDGNGAQLTLSFQPGSKVGDPMLKVFFAKRKE